MTETLVVVACPQSATWWYLDFEPAKCTDSAHMHVRHELHLHRSAVVLPGGIAVTPVSFDPADPYSRDQVPDYGLYLDRRWQPPWSHDHLDWPDFGVPNNPADVIVALTDVLERARSGQRVEVGCLGGHGRTGTALAGLAILSGHPPLDAVAWVRTNYCASAVETVEQEAFASALTS